MTQEQATVELKPCPFCGSTPFYSDGWLCHPNNNCVIGAFEFGGNEGAAWNRRAERLAPPAVPAEQAQPASAVTAMPMDAGPWRPSLDGKHAYSDDFEYDVTLRITGDFGDDELRREYAEQLCAHLNSAHPVQAHSKSEYKRRVALGDENVKPPIQASSAAPSDEPCPRGANKPEPTCTNRHQCWEPCGELGHSEEHARFVSPERTAKIDAALGIDKPSDRQQFEAFLRKRYSDQSACPWFLWVHADLSYVYSQFEWDTWRAARAATPPSPTPSAPEGQPRMPLSDEDIAAIAEGFEASDPEDSFWRNFARAIEAAHGIPPEGGEKGGNHG